ncbi:hypothetical protein niasHS_016377 [Heterodera schachtii]|uniref:Uncharacterized protein n=1 Tax=Heterodera schachtii TaxID=97005 RepID=A0ABD2I1J6_HETSC
MFEHSEIMTQLTVGQSTECQNALSQYLANSIGQMKGAKNRLKTFFTSPLKGTAILDNLLQGNASFAQVFRSDLTPDEISQLQVKYYLNYMDSDSETDVHTRALFMANFLAFYHWFKNRQQKLSKKMLPDLENLFLKIELQMDLIACSESATDKAAKKAHKKEMMSLRSDKDKLFPEAQVIDIEKGVGNRSNLLETEISLLSMHNEIMEGLIENEQHFLDTVKTIFIDVQRLQKMIPRMTLAYQILMENSKGSKQKKNENENNGKEDEKEKGEGGEKVEEKGGGRGEKGEEKEKGDEKTRGREQKGGEMEPDGEKRKAEDKGEEKGEERGGADGEKGEENDGEIIEEGDKKGREKGSESGRAENERCVDSDADSDLVSCYQHLMLADRPISSPKFDDLHELDLFYLALFSSTDSETTFEAETFLGLKLMETLIYQTEKVVLNPVNFTEIITTRAKLRAMMAVQLHFRDADKFRIICYQIAYVTYLVQKRNLPSTVWQSPTECFLMDREETLSSMRTLLQPSHLNFVISQLNGGPAGNSISDTVRQKRGALALLEKLIGGTALIKLWENKEARAKLMEANCK